MSTIPNKEQLDSASHNVEMRILENMLQEVYKRLLVWEENRGVGKARGTECV